MTDDKHDIQIVLHDDLTDGATTMDAQSWMEGDRMHVVIGSLHISLYEGDVSELLWLDDDGK